MHELFYFNRATGVGQLNPYNTWVSNPPAINNSVSGATIDSNGTGAHVASTSSDFDGWHVMVEKYDQTGTAVSSRLISITHQTQYGAYYTAEDLKIDSSGNTVVLAYYLENSINQWVFQLIKVGTSGSILWSKTIAGPTGDTTLFGRYITISPTGDICVFIDDGGKGSLSKFSSSGNMIFYRKISTSDPDGGYYQPSGLVTDSSGAIYISYSISYGGGSIGMLCKLDQNGYLDWSRTLGPSSTPWAPLTYTRDSVTGITLVDGNVVLLMHHNHIYETGYNGWSVMVIDPDGNLVKRNDILSNSYSYAEQPGSIDSDSDGNIYIYSKEVYGGFIAKFNSSLDLIWQRLVNSSDISLLQTIGWPFRISVDPYGTVWVAGRSFVNWNDAHSVYKMKSDGSGIGQYGPLVYEPSYLLQNTGLFPIYMVGITSQVSTIAAQPIDVSATNISQTIRDFRAFS